MSGLLLLTHYWSIWLLGAVELVLAWRWWRHPGDRGRAGRAFLAIAVGGVLFVPWLPSFLYQAAHTGTPWAGRVRPTNLIGATIQDFGGGAFKDAIFVGAVMVVLALLGLFGRGTDATHIDLDLRTRRFVRYEAVVAAATLAIGGTVGLVTASTYATRYSAVIYPLFALLVAAGLTCFRSPKVLTGGAGDLPGAVPVRRLLERDLPAHPGPRRRTAPSTRWPNPVISSSSAPTSSARPTAASCRSDLDELVYPTLGPPQRVDWVDYAARNAAANPAKIAQQILARAGSHAVFLVWQGAYRTFGDQCETLFSVLAAARPGARTLVVSGGDAYFEPAAVVRFPPRR